MTVRTLARRGCVDLLGACYKRLVLSYTQLKLRAAVQCSKDPLLGGWEGAWGGGGAEGEGRGSRSRLVPTAVASLMRLAG